jgi:hypothetical protein
MSKSKQVRQAEIKVIQDRLNEWKTDNEIMKELNIPTTTYYRYKHSIYMQDNKLLEKVRSNELAHRILQVRKSLEYCIQVNKKICEHSKDDRARIDASAMIVKAQMGLLNLINSGPNSEQVRIITRDVIKSAETEQ